MSVKICNKSIIDSIVRIQYTPNVDFFNIYPRDKIYKIALISYPADYGYGSENKFGQMLLEMNAYSYNKRYKHHEDAKKVLEEHLLQAAKYEFSPPHDGMSQLDIAIKGYASIRYWKCQCADIICCENWSIYRAIKYMEMEVTYRVIQNFVPQIDNMYDK